MSEPLEFSEEAEALVKAVEEASDEAYSGDFPHPVDVAVIYARALREAAAKALEWAGCQFFVMRTLDDGPAADPLAEVIAELRKP